MGVAAPPYKHLRLYPSLPIWLILTAVFKSSRTTGLDPSNDPYNFCDLEIFTSVRVDGFLKLCDLDLMHHI
jgi:hypothetical protein